MRGRFAVATVIKHTVNQCRSKMPQPDMIDGDPRGQRIVSTGNPPGQCRSSAGAVSRINRTDRRVRSIRFRQCRRRRFARCLRRGQFVLCLLDRIRLTGALCREQLSFRLRQRRLSHGMFRRPLRDRRGQRKLLRVTGLPQISHIIGRHPGLQGDVLQPRRDELLFRGE